MQCGSASRTLSASGVRITKFGYLERGLLSALLPNCQPIKHLHFKYISCLGQAAAPDQNCEAQGKGRAWGRLRKVTERSFIDGGWWMVDILSLMLYTKFGCHHLPSTASLLISRIRPSIDQVR